ncbi:hypothetical protein DFH09DRAFT_1287306 [Mycena vulgaris]|nr:hypothetical protein DFH09DRAFT_1287306 [Mycena vulgaris]
MWNGSGVPEKRVTIFLSPLMPSRRQEALGIPEFVELICFHTSHPQRAHRCLLANLARSSRNFLDPALSVLWETQDTLANILRCMPLDLWDESVLERSLILLDTTRAIVPADWERPLFYLFRVKEFTAGRQRDMPTPQLFQMLSSSLPTTHLFPTCPAILPYIRILLAPRLTNLRLSSVGSDGDLAALSPGPYLCLTDLTIECRILGAREFRTRISPFILGLMRLERLRIYDLDQGAFEHLATLPRLESLTVTQLSDLASYTTSQLCGETLFSGLHNLKITTRTTETALTVITAVGGPVTKLHIKINGPTTIPGVSALCAVLAKATLPLRCLDIVINRIASPAGTDPPSHERAVNRALQHLFRLSTLEDLSLEVGDDWDLDDALILEMALASLRVIASRCPKLAHLGLDVDARIVPPPDPTAPSQTALTVLHVGYSPITHSSAVTDFVFDIFPVLELIGAKIGMGPP